MSEDARYWVSVMREDGRYVVAHPRGVRDDRLWAWVRRQLADPAVRTIYVDKRDPVLPPARRGAG